MKRAYSVLTVKAVNDEERVIEGIASTPSADRMGDVVEPMGAKFALPMPLLWQHQADKPVGFVEFAEPTKRGIPFRARLASVADPGAVRDRIEEAWQSVKAGLVRGVSIGFRSLDEEYDREKGGYVFKEWEWLELSLVTIPANAEATIQTIKSYDRETLAASGKKASGRDEPAASGDKPKPVIKGVSKMAKKQTLAEQIAAFQDTLAEKSARMSEIVDEAEGSTLDAEQQEEFDSLEAEIGEINGHVKRLRTLQKAAQASARPVEDVTTGEKASEAREPRVIAAKAKAPAPEAGIRFARLARAKALSFLDHEPLDRVVERHYSNRDPELVTGVKAAVAAGTSSNTSALIGNYGGIGDFVEFLRPMTIVGRFGGAFPSLRSVPFRVPLITEASESDAQWVGEAKGKPLTRPTATRTELTPLKVATISVQTMELIRDSSPSSEAWLRDSLAASIAKRLDLTFIDPAVTASAGLRPASITNGAGSAAASGTDADSIREDVRVAMGAFIAANNMLNTGVWIMSNATALSLSLMRNALGQREFPDITMNGGSFEGLPVMASQYVGNYVALVNAQDIWVADEGGVDLQMSTEASLEMVDNPTHDSGAATPVATSVVSMFQTNSVAFRAERTISWLRRRPSAVRVVTSVDWGAPSSGV
jgi:HK97 family phage major capsid protein/HK97 family phage prohead protease